MSSWNSYLKGLGSVIAVGAVAASMGGCALVEYSGSLERTAATSKPVPGPTEAMIKTHPIVVGKVRVDLSKKNSANADKSLHPLPDSDYAKLLAWELGRALHAEGLDQGKGSPIKANVLITDMQYRTNLAFATSYFRATTTLDLAGVAKSGLSPLSFSVTSRGAGNFYSLNTGPAYMRDRFTIPGAAVSIADVLAGIRKDGHFGGQGMLTELGWDQTTQRNPKIVGPLTPAQSKMVLGYTPK